MKKRIALLAAIILIFSVCLPILGGCQKIVYDFTNALSNWDDVKQSTTQGVNALATLTATSGNSTPSNVHNYNGNCVLLEEGNYAEYSVNLQRADSLAICVDYFIEHNGLSDTEISVSVNGAVVTERSPLKALWKNETEDFRTDSFGNQVVPTQKKIEEWKEEYLYDYDYATVLPLMFDFSEGENIITFQVSSHGSFLLGNVRVCSVEMPPEYNEYRSANADKNVGSTKQVVEAEHFYSKNTLAAVPTAMSDLNITPYDTYASMLNVVSGFNSPEQILTYKFTAETDGLYNFSFNYQNSNSNRTAYIQVFLDGKTPFQELLRYPLTENGEFSSHTLGNADGAFDFYLTAGEHLFSVKIDGSLVRDTETTLSEIIDDLNDVYLDLKLIAGTVSDGNREWDVDNDFPGVVERLQEIDVSLGQVMDDLMRVNGATVNYQSLIYVRTAQQAVQGLLKTPKYIPNKYAQLSEGSGSIVQTLSNALSDIGVTAVDFDRFVLHPSATATDIKGTNFFVSFWEGTKKFFHSFFQDYSNTTEDEKTIQVWVARSRQYVDLMQQMIDGSDFTQKTGYNVKFSILADEGKLILSNAANIAPNAVMGISNWLPYEMGIRGLTVDLTEFDDYGEVISRFSPGAMISLIADGKGLALPETQDFYVTYYRSDILAKYGLEVPDTWDDVVEMLPVLQRYGLNFYIPLSTSTSSKSIMTTAPFIYQYGGTLFTDDGMATTISDEKSMEAIKFMTELYTHYGLPQQVSNFFDSFRSGSLPIGISTFETYIRLSMAAPEISGKWGIALSPGKYDENLGEVARWQTGSATAMTLLKSDDVNKDNAGWELLKWWSSAEVQTDFMNRLTMIYGKSYIWNSANTEAFSNSIAFKTADKKVIMEQWRWMREIPKVPGWYMLERELSNAWNSIVIDGENTRSVIENAVTVVDKELKRKLTEFGYIADGVVVTPYKLTTLETVNQLMNGGVRP